MHHWKPIFWIVVHLFEATRDDDGQCKRQQETLSLNCYARKWNLKSGIANQQNLCCPMSIGFGLTSSDLIYYDNYDMYVWTYSYWQTSVWSYVPTDRTELSTFFVHACRNHVRANPQRGHSEISPEQDSNPTGRERYKNGHILEAVFFRPSKNPYITPTKDQFSTEEPNCNLIEPITQRKRKLT